MTTTNEGGESRLSTIRPLRQDERDDAKTAARESIVRQIGDAPTPEAFSATRTARFPGWLSVLVAVLVVLAILAAFALSAMRLYHVGFTEFGKALTHEDSQKAAGIAVVLLSEITQVATMIALAFFTGFWSQFFLLIVAGLATAIAIGGNISFEHLADAPSDFAWLLSIAPSLIVLGLGFVLKTQALHAIEAKRASTRLYEDALAAWEKARVADPEQHDKWTQTWANALRDGIRRANSRQKDVLNELGAGEWRALVVREMQADNWFAFDPSVRTNEPRTNELSERRPAALPRPTERTANEPSAADSERTVQADERTNARTGFGYERTHDAKEVAIAWFNAHPDQAMTLKLNDLYPLVGVGRTSVGDALRIWKAERTPVSPNGHSESEGG
jgi:hypothetical protein